MNPSLQYAQAIPGVSPGRGIGIIDTLHIIEIPKAVEAMAKSPAFTPELMGGLKQWFANYVTWMRTSKNGNEEQNAGNNHAVACWLQIAVFAEFTDDEKNLAEALVGISGDPELREKFRKNARATINSRYNAVTMTRQTEEVYHALGEGNKKNI